MGLSCNRSKEKDLGDHILSDIIAFVNPKSGGQKGQEVYSKLKALLPTENVFDLTKGGPRAGLEMHKFNPNLKVIACGGDGTAGWILSVLDELNYQKPPSVAVLPLGTGNDLARTLGWGGGYKNESLRSFLKRVSKGKVVKLDRWDLFASPKPQTSRDSTEEVIQVEGAKKSEKLPLSVLNNYFSIGADAKIALEFHLAREKNPEAFKSPAYNKIEYGKKYSKDLFVTHSCKNLTDHIVSFDCDGVSVLDQIKKLKSHAIVVLNIPSYASGTNPWNKKKPSFDPQSMNDSKLEVIGLSTSDLMMIQIGVTGDTIAQAKSIKIVTSASLPMQVDGEACLLQPSEIRINLKNKANMISATPEREDLTIVRI